MNRAMIQFVFVFTGAVEIHPLILFKYWYIKRCF